MPTIMPIYGTRPEAIKMAPLIRALRSDSRFALSVTVTGQHRQMLDQVNALFDIVPDFDLEVLSASGGLAGLSARILDRLAPILSSVAPDAVLVQGDTTTAAVGALAAYYAQIPVIHLEAGLRSGNLNSPFPEEGNRKLISQLAALHLAPTESSRANLLAEGVDPDTIVVTGNTVIDALLHVVDTAHTFTDDRITAAVDSGNPILLVTTHRRESWETGIASTARALRRISAAHPEARIVLPQHANPMVRETLGAILDHSPHVILTDALDYGQFTTLLSKSHLVLTDSGGVQEEAPSLGIPVLVTRDTTERPEGITAGTVRLVGTEENHVVEQVLDLLDNPDSYGRMSRAVNPYGDGQASERSLAALLQFFDLGERLADFTA